MVRVQPDRFRLILDDEVMESQYHQFGSSDNSPVSPVPGELRMTAQTGMKRIVVYVLYGVVVLLLLILLMVTGVKFSQLNKEVINVKLSLERIHLSSNSGATLPEVPLQKIATVSGTCREGWVSFQGGCYFLSTTGLIWHRAETQCKTLGGHLLVLNNVEELDFISQIVEITHNYWIGLVERTHEGHWSWVDGTDFNTTPNWWDVGQPDNWDYRENGEDCGQIHGFERRIRKKLNDADCGLQYRYICEIRA
ncbi:asialoglycoprotein receptor-like 1 [Epinephelus fuscoguttatus]|uniref:asialoglycoprotein receptor-like 1 n=1 Tax=Epinephelus fuscoguttatus TaxID=293821 RepID=UPI0020D11212|nr:asialoglycoprotein receptor-like 1 [Epinephelus fuscoguttatus]